MKTILLNTFLITLFVAPITYAAPSKIINDPTTSLAFSTIPAGSFLMGTTNLDEAVAEMPKKDINLIKDETPVHKVTFNHSFLMATTEVSQGLWLKIMQNKPGPLKHWQHKSWANLPVVSVNWFDTQAFIKQLNQLSTKFRYRLPTEAEWEYTARAGSNALRPFSMLEMDEYAWYINNSNDEIQPVATKLANSWGIYDLYGNAWEWVSDWYQPSSYTNSDVSHPLGPKKGVKKVRRGGSYHCPPHLIRPGYRAANTPDKAYSVLGFRLIAEYN